MLAQERDDLFSCDSVTYRLVDTFASDVTNYEVRETGNKKGDP